MAKTERFATCAHPDAPWNRGLVEQNFTIADDEFEYRIEVGANWKFYWRRLGNVAGAHGWQLLSQSTHRAEIIRMLKYLLLLALRQLARKKP